MLRSYIVRPNKWQIKEIKQDMDHLNSRQTPFKETPR